MTSIEITRPDPETGGTRFVVDGVDLSNALSGIEVEFSGPDHPRVTLRTEYVQEFRLCSDVAEVIIDERILDILREQGWSEPRADRPRVVAAEVKPKAAKAYRDAIRRAAE